MINNLGEPSETPEHNAMQAQFLDDGFVARFVMAAEGIEQQIDLTEVEILFEHRGYDVVFIARWDGGASQQCIEAKPTVGDDYPAVLRQMKRAGLGNAGTLYIGTYTGVGATLEQVRKIFAASNIKIVMDVDLR